MPTNQQLFEKWKGSRNVYIETGAEYGASIWLARQIGFAKIYSIELHQPFHDHCVDLYGGDQRVTMILGNSADKLAELLPTITEPALFWLDAHWGPSDKGCPLINEVLAIVGHPVKGHVVLIDDVSDFRRMGVSTSHLESLLPTGAKIVYENDRAYLNGVMVMEFPA